MQLILGSQSPRRRELLETVVGNHRLRVLAPQDADEPGFDGLTSTTEIKQQLRQIVRLKHQDVSQQLDAEAATREAVCLITADTIVVAEDETGQQKVLGKPPQTHWQQTMRNWFEKYYNNRPHQVWTAVRISWNDQVREFIVSTTVQLCPLNDRLINWYLSTEESIGKAGGYGIQGKAALLVDGIQGSLTNVIGLPMRDVMNVLDEVGLTR